MRPDLLRIYTTLCETKSFTKTSQVLGVPKSSVTAAIQKIEEEVGSQLLQRTTRTVQITDDGNQFYEKCVSVLADMQELSAMFKTDNSSVSGKIRVDMPVPMATQLVLPNLKTLLAKHPNLQIELGSTDRQVHLIQEGYDLVVRVGKLNDSSLIARKVGEYKIINCVSSSYVKKYGLPKKLEDLNKHYQVHYSQVFGSQRDGFEYFNGERFVSLKTNTLVHVNNTEAYTNACLNGLGLIQAPEPGLRPHLKTKALVQVLTKFRAEPLEIYFVYPRGKLLAKRVRVFMDWLEPLIKDYCR